MRGYPQFSFWISITLVKIYISCIITHRGKNTFELVGTVLKCLVLSLECSNGFLWLFHHNLLKCFPVVKKRRCCNQMVYKTERMSV